MNALQSFETRIWRNRALNRAVRSTYVIWAQSYPVGESALFDNDFVQGELMPFLGRFVDGEPGVNVTELIQTWAAHLQLSDRHRQQWSAKLTPAVQDFLHILEDEYEYQCKRRGRSLWYKLWYSVEPNPVAVAG